MCHWGELENGKVTLATRGKKNEKENLLKNESMNTTRTKETDVRIDLDQLIHESKEQFELLQTVYNALANAYLRNLEDSYESDYWFVKCEGTDIITNELGDIIRKSDGAVIAKAKGLFAIAAAYSAEVIVRGGTAEKIYVSQ